ncbi:hypothetical protein Tco_0855003 [Tanacetum coccineum]
METPTKNALIAQDGIGGYDWSYQAEEEHLTNFALMAYTSSGSFSNLDSEVDSCSKTCVKAYATLKEQYDSLNSDYNKSQFNLVSYKAGLESVEARLARYKKNEDVFEESINVLKLEVRQTLCSRVIKGVKRKEKKGKEKIFPPPYKGNFIPRKPYLTFMDEIVKSENMDVTTVVTPSNVKNVVSNHESAGVKNNGDAVEPKNIRENSFRPLVIEDWDSDDDSKCLSIFIMCGEKKDIIPRGGTTQGLPGLAIYTAGESVNTAGARINTAFRPVNTAGTKPTVNTASGKDTTARYRAVVSENKRKRANAVKASACWVWKAKNSSASNTFKKYSYIDARGRSKYIMA